MALAASLLARGPAARGCLGVTLAKGNSGLSALSGDACREANAGGNSGCPPVALGHAAVPGPAAASSHQTQSFQASGCSSDPHGRYLCKGARSGATPRLAECTAEPGSSPGAGTGVPGHSYLRPRPVSQLLLVPAGSRRGLSSASGGGSNSSSTQGNSNSAGGAASGAPRSSDASDGGSSSGGAASTSDSASNSGSTSSGSSSNSGSSSRSGGDGTPQRPIVLHIRQQDGTAGFGAAGNELMRRAGAALLAGASQAAARLNELTGYNVIERLKAQVDQADDGLAAARQELRAAKALYEQRQAQHSDVQRQLMSLLQRKGSWAAADVERFAGLCRDEHGLEGAVAAAKAAYGSAAEGLESAHAALLRSIRERYAAETLWSDKIRRASTWWTAGLMGLHLASFLSVYLVMEPIKAARLRDHVEGVLRAELSAVRSSVGQLQNTLDSHVAEVEEVEASARAAAGVAVAAAGTAVAGAAAAGLPAAASAGSVGPRKVVAAAGAQEQQPEASVTGLEPEMLALRQRLEGMEKRVGEVVAALTAHTAALQAQAAAVAQGSAPGLRSPVLRQPGPVGDSGGMGSAAGQGMGSSATAPAEVEGGVGEAQEEHGGIGAVARRWGRRGVRWGRALAAALARAANAPETATGAAAFAGAALGVGLALLLAGGSAGAAGPGSSR